MQTDICVIGGGAAGLLSAITAAKQGAQVVVIESNTNPGRKLLITGGGRCNITNNCSVHEFLQRCEPYSRFLRHSLYEFSPSDVCEFFELLGIDLTIEENSCVFPKSNKAGEVLTALIDHAKELGVIFYYDKSVNDIQKEDDHFTIKTSDLEIASSCVVIATGGISYPKTGSTGDGYKFAKSFGHEIIPPRACLVPLVCKEDWLENIAGVPIERAVLSTKIGKKKIKMAGPVIFTNNGIGGPVVLNFSRIILDELQHNSVNIELDLAQGFDVSILEEEIIEKVSQSPKKEIARTLMWFVPYSLAIVICKLAGVDRSMISNQLRKEQRQKITRLLKAFPLTVTSTRGPEEATVTRGGVSAKQIEPKTMESKIVPGLYFAGEVIDVDGPCGGYNLQIAWSSGFLAGRSAADKAK